MATPTSEGHAAVEGDHPQLDWAVATGLAYLRPGDWVPVLVEWRMPGDASRGMERPEDPRSAPASEPPRDRASERPREPPDPRWFSRGEWLMSIPREWVCILPFFADLADKVPRMRQHRLGAVLLRRDRIAEIVRSEDWRSAIGHAEMGPPVFLNDKLAAGGTLADAPEGAPGAGLKHPGGPRVVIGVIDQGIAFANARFRNKDGTRIAYVWQQEFRAGFSPTSLGSEITAAQIDAAMQAAGDDEDAVYRTLGGLRFDVDGYKPLARQRTHGTHVLDGAAGAKVDDDVRNFPIIAVDMPEHAVGDPAGSTLVPHALLGLIYILLRANSLRSPNETLPVVVNLSYGPHEGPHDGTSPFELFTDHLIDAMKSTATPLQIVLAAGNARQARVHAELPLAPGATRTLHWRVQPCGRTPSEMQLWWPAGRSVRVTLRPPTSDTDSVSVFATQNRHEHDEGGWVDFGAYRGTSWTGELDGALLCIAPTELDPRVAGGHAVAPAGVWTVDLKNEDSVPVRAQAWIRRGDTPPGRRAKGRQSYFEEHDYPRHDATGAPVHYDVGNPSAVRRLGTVSGIATGCRTTVVGSFVRGNEHPAPYSSAGPHDNAHREDPSPSLLAGGDDSIVRRGVLAAGTRSGSAARVSGTSAAAPHVTRALAQAWLAGTAPNLGPVLRPPKGPAAAAAELPFVAGRGLLP